jgi:hypothetical protein
VKRNFYRSQANQGEVRNGTKSEHPRTDAAANDANAATDDADAAAEQSA